MAVFAVSGGTLDLSLVGPEFGFGNDIVGITGGNNTIWTWEGSDVVYATRSLAGSLQTAYLGMGNDVFQGGSGGSTVYDGSGADTVIGGSGRLSIYAGTGNDLYVGGSNSNDIIYFLYAPNDGTPVFNNSVGVKCDLAVTTAQNLGVFGIDRLSGFEQVYGSLGNDRFYGNSASNTLFGDAGNDVLDGRAGIDSLIGGDGADLMTGGAAADYVSCFEITAARDTIRFLSLADGTVNPLSCDLIEFFDRGTTATDDRIDLSAIDANPLLAGNQGFIWRGSGAFTAAPGEVRIATSGADTIVYVDNDNDPAAEMVIRIMGVTGILGTDFIL